MLFLLCLVIGKEIVIHLRGFLANTTDIAPDLCMSGADLINLQQNNMLRAVQGETLGTGSARCDDYSWSTLVLALVLNRGSRRLVLELLYPKCAVCCVVPRQDQVGMILREVYKDSLVVLAILI